MIKKLLVAFGVLLALWLLCGVVFVIYGITKSLDNMQFNIEGRIASAVKGTEIYAGDELYCSININYTAEEVYSKRLKDAFAYNRKTGIHSHILRYINIFNRDYVGNSSGERLAKQLFPEASGNELILIANELERIFPDKIDDVYCNSIAFGDGIYGLEAAARFYFEKTAEELSKDEIIHLKNPHNLSGNPYVMLDDNGAFINGLRRQLSQYLTYEQIYNGGYKVYSTLESSIQAALDKTIVNESVPDFFQIGMLICDYSGNIVGAAGGASPEAEGSKNLFNRTSIPLSVGSAIKPISIYTAAIENNTVTYSALLPDTPFADNWPQNYNNINEGQVTVAYAVRQSKNTVAVCLADTLGTEALYTRLKGTFRFSSLSDYDDSLQGLALGYLKGGVTLEELALAYQSLGNGGMRYDACYFTKVIADDGAVVFSKADIGASVIGSQTAGIMNRLLRSNIVMPDGLGTNADMPGVEVIGKTGTTDNSNGVIVNTLFAGATPGYVGVVWVGSDDQGIEKPYGFFPPATEVWRRVMEKISHKKNKFEIDSTLVSAYFCTDTGLLADACINTEQGWYKPDNLPKTCTVHNKVVS